MPMGAISLEPVEKVAAGPFGTPEAEKGTKGFFNKLGCL
jgi:hypothetical protein